MLGSREEMTRCPFELLSQCTADNYMVKMVLHLDGPGLVTLPLSKLADSIEDANQTVLTCAQLKKVEKERRGNVLVIDKYGPHLQKRCKDPQARCSRA